MKKINLGIKRIFDIFASLIGLIILSPILALIAIAIKCDSKGPVFFLQERIGKVGKTFNIYKFRTMVINAESIGEGLICRDDCDPRITRMGKILRKTSLDELPQLINVLLGEMSIVGPRPQLVRDMVFMTKEQRRRHKVTQGLTGLAQVSGRNNISWEEKLAYDQEYVKHITFLGDLKIIFKTIGNVLKKEDINTDGMATAEDFGDYLLRTGQVDQETYDRKQRIARKICEKNNQRG